MRVIGTGFRIQSSIGEVFSTYLHSSSSLSCDASASRLILTWIPEYPGRMLSDNPRNACKFKSPSILSGHSEIWASNKSIIETPEICHGTFSDGIAL